MPFAERSNLRYRAPVVWCGVVWRGVAWLVSSHGQDFSVTYMCWIVIFEGGDWEQESMLLGGDGGDGDERGRREKKEGTQGLAD